MWLNKVSFNFFLSQVPLEELVLLDLPEALEELVQPAHLDLLDLWDRKETQVSLDHLDNLEGQVLLALMAVQERPDRKVTQVVLESLEELVPLEIQAYQAKKDLPVPLEGLELEVQVLLDLLVHLDSPEEQVFLAPLDLRANLDLQDQPNQPHLDRPDSLALRDCLGLPVCFTY